MKPHKPLFISLLFAHTLYAQASTLQEDETVTNPVINTTTIASATADRDTPLMQKNLKLDTATYLAKLAIGHCKTLGYSVSVTVVDRSGTILALQRAESAGALTLGSSEGKAVTAASFKTPTLDLMEKAQKYPNAINLVHIPGALLLAGGLPIKENGELIGAIGVGGAPDGKFDEQCAAVAIKKITNFDAPPTRT